MKTICILLVLISQIALAGNETGKGGGGIQRNGEILTFGKAGIGLKVQSLDRTEVPGYTEAENGIQALILDQSSKSRLLQAITPSMDRRYFRISQQDLSRKKREELLNIYKSTVKEVPLSNLVILAVTDPATRETYLLPEFFYMKDPKSQAAVLFHEGVWILQRSWTYAFVVDLEMSFEKFLNTGGFVEDLYLRLGELFKQKSVVLQAAANADIQEGHLAGILDADGTVSNKILFGETFWEELLTDQDPKPEFFSRSYLDNLDQERLKRGWERDYTRRAQLPTVSPYFDLISMNLLQLMKNYPKSHWLRLFYGMRDQFSIRRDYYYINKDKICDYMRVVRFNITATPTQATEGAEEVYALAGNAPRTEPDWHGITVNPRDVRIVIMP